MCQSAEENSNRAGTATEYNVAQKKETSDLKRDQDGYFKSSQFFNQDTIQFI